MSVSSPPTARGEDGYELWMRYVPVSNPHLRTEYRNLLRPVTTLGDSASLGVARRELEVGLSRLLERSTDVPSRKTDSGLILVTKDRLGELSPSLRVLTSEGDGEPLRELLARELPALGDEGYALLRWRGEASVGVVIAANTGAGALYGAFALLRAVQTQVPQAALAHSSAPKIQLRMLNHWDNLDRSVERGYAGSSLWDWQLLPDYLSPRYTDYARALASVGINATVLTNVNANARVLTQEFLVKVAALAQVFRPFGVRVFLTARFNAPVELGDLETADPHDPLVQTWWSNKAQEIYRTIPDFGGFVVKANSEGQPGPREYDCTHAEGANLLADALAAHGGVVVWRAFVYDEAVPEDRAKQAYDEFVPLDGAFRPNVVVQVKNGPIDFQPREPVHPLFGAMPKTPLALEFQLTQEYLGFATHLVYLAPLFQEVLQTDTWRRGPGSTVARVVDGSLEQHQRSAIAAVSNIGTERNWCGHPFAQANWYAFGRLAWDPDLSAAQVAEEWLRMTFTNDTQFVDPARQLMLDSREICVDYMTPLGLHHIMAYSHHYGPGPWIDHGRADWTSVYYHRADGEGLGFDRTSTGSDALAQYAPEVHQRFAELERCPKEFLLWFHHVPWDHRLDTGRTLWEELCHRYYTGAAAVRRMQNQWEELRRFIDSERFTHIEALLAIQAKEARWWRDACVLYFQTFSKREIPAELPRPERPLEYYRALKHHHVPGN